MQEIPSPVGLGNVSYRTFGSCVFFLSFFFSCGNNLPSDKAHSEIYNVLDLFHGRRNQHLQAVLCIGALGHDVDLQWDLVPAGLLMIGRMIAGRFPPRGSSGTE